LGPEAKKAARIVVDTVHYRFEMQMDAGYRAGSTHRAKYSAHRNGVALADLDGAVRHMEVLRDKAASVSNVHRVSLATI
jgi:hypothetical protein